MRNNVFRLLILVSCVYIVLDADRYFSAEMQQTIGAVVPYVLVALGVFSVVTGAIRYIRARAWSDRTVGDLLTGIGVMGWGWILSHRNVRYEDGIAGIVLLVVVICVTLVAFFWGGRLLRKAKRDRRI